MVSYALKSGLEANPMKAKLAGMAVAVAVLFNTMSLFAHHSSSSVVLPLVLFRPRGADARPVLT